ncbi:MAG: hypothetical protein ACNA8W_11350 [Bradymonadaceae bacterium]
MTAQQSPRTPDSTAKNVRWIQFRRIGVLSAMKFQFFIGLGYLVSWSVYGVFAARNFVEELLINVLVVGIAGPIVAFMAAITYNAGARLFGGLLIEIGELPSPGPITQACPACNEPVLQSRSFCPHCDHDLAVDETDGEHGEP